MDRRSFIKLTAVSGSTAALASCGNPDHQLIRFVPAEDIVPGQATWKPSVCPLCASGCGLAVRVMDAEADVVRDGKTGIVQIVAAKKLEGNPNHPVNRGGLCARGQAAIQVTYHPDRITQPLKRGGNRGEGKYEAIAWDVALKEVAGKLDALAAGGTSNQLAFLTRNNGSGHRAALIAQFLSKFGAPAAIHYELFADDVLRRANAISFGREQLPTFDLANARYVLNFGADILATWNAPVAHARSYGEMRQGRSGIRGRLVQIETRMSQTGASADEWVPIRPGTEGALANAIAAALKGDTAALEEAEKATGVQAARIERLAKEFKESGPAIAMIGGAALAYTNGLSNALAVNALNTAAGNLEKPGGIYFTPQFDVAAAAKVAAGNRPAAVTSLQKLAAGLLDGSAPVQALFIDGVNPVFTSPRGWKVKDALNKIPFIVSFGSFLDETSALADIILPDHSFLESWTEAVPESGSTTAVVGAAPPVMMPLHDTRSTPDVLLDLGRQLQTPIELPWQTFDEMLGATFAALPEMTEGVDAWTDAQEKGFWTGTLPAAGRLKPDTTNGPSVASGFSRTNSDAQFDGDAGQYPFHFLPYPSNQFLDGSLAHLPWLQEMPDPLTSAMWSSWIEINPAAAAKLGIAQGDVVDVASPHGTLRTAVVISPGLPPDVVAMPAGQGHTMFTRYATGRGENPVDLLAPVTEETTGAVAWASTRVKVTRVSGADGRLVLFAGEMREQQERAR